jgi:tripartite-type tricarboxylate transporter receptor subunit TctC
MRVLLSCLLLFAAGGMWAWPATAAYPDKPIHILVTVPPGGAADIIARTVGAKLSQLLGVSVIVENRGGASGTIAAGLVARAAPDGYTLLQNSITTQGIGPYLFPKLPYDSFKDFAPISLLATLPEIMTVSADMPIKSVDAFVALAKSKPGQLSFASSGSGSAPHMTGELFKMATGTNLLHVPYKGSGPAAMDVASGRVQAMFDAAPSLMPYVQAGKLRVLAAASEHRNALMPDVPTFAELGYKDMNVLLWYGILAPAGTPTAIIARLNKALGEALAAPDLRQQFAQQGIDATHDTPEEFANFMMDDYLRWGAVIKKANLTFE